MHTRCFCDTCRGTLVSLQTHRNHQRKQLKTETISERLQQQRKTLPAAQNSAGPSSLVPPGPSHACLPSGISFPLSNIAGPPNTSDGLGSLAQASISVSDLDDSTHVIYDTTPGLDPLSGVVSANPEYVHVDDDYFADEDTIFENADLGDEDNHLISTALMSDLSEDNPDPFVVEARDRKGTVKLPEPETPPHLLVAYTIVTWLHLQFHLPHVACNAMLGFLALLFRFLGVDLTPPFITLHSATRALGINPGVELLAVCPGCRGVYPSAGSKHMQNECSSCHIPLFLPDHTRQGNHHAVKIPLIKYPYLPLSEQITSILKTPGVEALLDDWRSKPRNSGEYGDIFDGRMCRLKLRAPDGSLFFSNCPHESHGPNDELRIGVNLGVDWCVPCPASYYLNNPWPRFSYIRSNIAPSHSSCPTSFSICNLPPEFRCVMLHHPLHTG
jgi:hypothetical protein